MAILANERNIAAKSINMKENIRNDNMPAIGLLLGITATHTNDLKPFLLRSVDLIGVNK